MDTMTYEQRKALEDKKEREIHKKLLAIAKALGFEPWKESDSNLTRMCITKDKQTLHLYVCTYGHKAYKFVEVSGSFPRDGKGQASLYNGEYPKHINIALTKEPEQIAKEILSRFMPTYEAALTKAETRIKEVAEKENKRESTIKQLAAILHVDYISEVSGESYNKSEKARINQWNGSEGHKVESLTIEPDYYATSIKFQIDVKPEVAAEICYLLAKHMKKI